MPTRRALVLFGLGLVPAVFSAGAPSLGWVALAWDVAVLIACVFDYSRAPRTFRLERQIDPVISAAVPHPVKLSIEAVGEGFAGPAVVRDFVPGAAVGAGHVFECDLGSLVEHTWRVTPETRGDLLLGPLTVRAQGPFGLASRQTKLAQTTAVKVYPDLKALTKEALALARAKSDDARRVVRQRSEGRELESLREYAPSDDRRFIDWKATARRGKPIVRQYQPERNQVVLLLLDCGRHMAGTAGHRRKLDLAVDAALRLAKVSLDRGDQVGLMAFARDVKAWMPPRRGAEALQLITSMLYRVEGVLEESDYGAALDLAFARGSRRALVVVLTDLLDSETSSSLVKRTLKLVPRHLPLVASLLDEEVHALAETLPDAPEAAYQRHVAQRLEQEYRQTVARLRDAGALVMRAAPAHFSAAAVNAYLDVKASGRL